MKLSRNISGAGRLRIAILLSISLSFHGLLFSQNCPTDIFAISYQGNAAIHIFRNIITPQRDAIVCGSSLGVNRALGYDGWIGRFSSQGTVLWAKRYMLPSYNNCTVYDVAMTSDSSFFATARFSFLRKRFVDNVIEEVYSVNVIMHLDKFGNLLDMHAFNKYGTYFTALNNIIPMGGNEYVITASISGNNYQRTLVFRTDAAMRIKWSLLLHADDIRLAGGTVKKSRDGNIILAGSAYQYNSNNAFILRQGYYMTSVDGLTGTRLWSKGYFSGASPQPPGFTVQGISSLSESADGNLFLYTSFSPNGRLLLPPYNEKALVMVTTPNGNLRKATSYVNTQPGCSMLEGQLDAAGNQLMLMDDGEKTILIKTTNDNNMLWQRSYGNMNGNLVGASILPGLPSHTILFRGRTSVAMAGLLKTEEDGAMACMETPVNIIGQDETSTLASEDIAISFSSGERDMFEPFGGGVGRTLYQFDPAITCQRTCCDDIASDTVRIDRCNMTSYRLPDNTLVKESGLYYSNHKTINDCDSIAFYDVVLDRSPVANLGPDDCLEERDSIVLKVDSTCTSYNWMGTQLDRHSFIARAPGKYWVTISNVCGSSTDSIEIFDECNFDVYIPGGFTPNNDGLNDQFGFPPQNRNRLIKLSVYNRWGQKIFETTDLGKNWDGKFSNMPQPAGVYVYQVEVELLTRKRIVKTGTVTLIR